MLPPAIFSSNAAVPNEVIVGPVESYVQVNVLAASLLFPTSSVNVPPAIDIVFVPSLSGVKVTE